MNTIKDARKTKPFNQVMNAKEWGLLIFLSAIWGGSFFFVGIAVKELPPLTIVLGRVALASAILIAVVHLKGLRMPSSPCVWGTFLVMGALNNIIPFCLIAWGQTHIEIGLASILNATTPIFGVLFAHVFTREEKMTPNRITGVLMGWTGVLVLIGIDSLNGAGPEVAGQIAVVGAAVSYGLAAIYGRRFKSMDTLVVATGMLCGATLMMTPLTLYVDQPWTLAPGASALLAILGLAAVSTALAYLIYFHLLAVSGPTNLLLVTFLIPVSAIGLGIMFLDERLGWDACIGTGMIFLGLIAIDGRLLKKL